MFVDHAYVAAGPSRWRGRARASSTSTARLRDAILEALRQRCHLRYDAEHHAETAATTRAAELAEQMDPLFAVIA